MYCKYYSSILVVSQKSQFMSSLNNYNYIIWKAVNESKPEVGSSSRMQQGLVTSSNPIDVLFFSPPEIPLRFGPPIMAF